MEGWLKSISESGVDFIGYPCSFGQDKGGVEKGPEEMRRHGVVRQLNNFNIPVRDLGDVEVVDYKETQLMHNIKRPRGVGEANKKLSKAVCESVKSGHMVVALGGDHSMGIGTVYGQCQAGGCVKVVWVDAHSDINPPLSSTSANSHGMPVCFLAKELEHLIPKNLDGFEWLKPCISVKDIVYIGLRDVDQAERLLLQEYQIKAFSAVDVSKLGISEVLRQTIDYLQPSKEQPIHLSLDIDALDPLHAPSTGTPVIGGLSLREGIHIVETLAATGALGVMDVAEVNTDLGTEADKQTTLDSAMEMVGALFGKRGTIPFLEK